MALLDDGDSTAMREFRRQARATRPLAPEDEGRLLERAALGDRASENRLVAAHLGLIIRLADTRAERGLSVSDLVQEGSIGLVEAVRAFADSGEVEFARFAEQRIGGQMDAAIEAEAAAVRDAELLVAAATDYERAQVVLRRTLQREATLAEVAEKLEWTVERTAYVAQVVADARRRHDEELLSFIDPEAIDLDLGDEDESAGLDG
ncbi:MAG TPA: sigma factor [Candidatus Dormibacteraeota bacterium]|nr:sigma factor [Candidatus Dormibacteraeota bacterium]